MDIGLTGIWAYLSREPLAALAATLLAWQAALWLQAKLQRHPLANPVLISTALLSAVLLLGGIDYRAYFQGAQFVHFLLGPATVALAVPLFHQWRVVRSALPAVLTSVVAGGAVAAGSGVAIAAGLGAAPQVVASLAPRSVTMPVAIGISEALGGLPSLTAAVVIASGIVGATVGPLLLDWSGVRDRRARGLAMGTASHGIGTARALAEHVTTGSFSGLAMGLNALATALLLPLLWRWL